MLFIDFQGYLCLCVSQMLEQKKVIDQGQEGKETGMKGTGRRKGQKKLKKLKGRIMRISIMEGKTVMNVYLKKKNKEENKAP